MQKNAKEKEVSNTKKKIETKNKKIINIKNETNESIKNSTKKGTQSKSTTKKTSQITKKEKSNKTTTKRTTKHATKESKIQETDFVNLNTIEYYDLPYKYGHTLVKLLAQTPKTLFVYWEISDLDIEFYKKQFGEDFFKKTKPILIVHNLTLNQTYEVEINDFANCWYLNTENSDCKFDIELARKYVNTNNYFYIAKSNNLNSPNDHILFEKLFNTIIFTNTKTGEKQQKNIEDFSFLNDLYTFYKNMYKDELLKNPSSNFLLK